MPNRDNTTFSASTELGSPRARTQPARAASIVPTDQPAPLHDRHWRRRSWIYGAGANSGFGTLRSQIARIDAYLDAMPDSAGKILSAPSIRTLPWVWAGLARGMLIMFGRIPAVRDDHILHAEQHHRTALRTPGKGDDRPLFAPERLGKGAIAFADDSGDVILFQGDALVAAGSALAGHLGLKAESVLHGSLPWQTVSGFVSGPMAALAAGATWSPAPLIDKTDGAAYLGSIYRYRATHAVLDRRTWAHVLETDPLYDDSFRTPDLQYAALLDDQPFQPLDHRRFTQKFGVDLAFLHGTDRLGGPCFGFCDADADEGTLGRPIGTEPALDEASRLTLQGERFRLQHFTQPALADLTMRSTCMPLIDTGRQARLDGAGRVCLVTAGGGDIADQATSSAIIDDVYRLAAERFQVEASNLGPESNGENTPGWSSLTSVELVLAIEAHFEIAFSPREVMNMISLNDVINAVQKHVPEA